MKSKIMMLLLFVFVIVIIMCMTMYFLLLGLEQKISYLEKNIEKTHIQSIVIEDYLKQ